MKNETQKWKKINQLCGCCGWITCVISVLFFLWLTGRRVWFWLVSRKDDGMKRWEADRGRRQTGRQGQDTQTLGRQRRRDVLTEGMAVNELRWQSCYQATCEWTIRKRCHYASPCIWFLQNIIDLTEWKCTTMHQGDSQHRQQIRTGTFSFKFILCPGTFWHTVTGDLLRFTCQWEINASCDTSGWRLDLCATVDCSISGKQGKVSDSFHSHSIYAIVERSKFTVLHSC